MGAVPAVMRGTGGQEEGGALEEENMKRNLRILIDDEVVHAAYIPGEKLNSPGIKRLSSPTKIWKRWSNSRYLLRAVQLTAACLQRTVQPGES
eukprot:668801-Hanusia_phi.AAC.2